MSSLFNHKNLNWILTRVFLKRAGHRVHTDSPSSAVDRCPKAHKRLRSVSPSVEFTDGEGKLEKKMSETGYMSGRPRTFQHRKRVFFFPGDRTIFWERNQREPKRPL